MSSSPQPFSLSSFSPRKGVRNGHTKKWLIKDEIDLFLRFKNKDLEAQFTAQLDQSKPKSHPNLIFEIGELLLTARNSYILFSPVSGSIVFPFMKYSALSPLANVLISGVHKHSIFFHTWSLVNSLVTFILLEPINIQTLGVDNLLLKIFLAMFVFFCIYEMKLLKLQLFFTELNYEHCLKERQLAEAKEIRAAIGNIAHDLKTPLTAFESGIELLSDITSKVAALQQHGGTSSPGPASSSASVAPLVAGSGVDRHEVIVKPLKDCSRTLKNINAFMLMTVHRCIDYNKTNKGMKLTPKYEVIDFHDILRFPIDCVTYIQEKIATHLQVLSPDIEKRIITDKQWLQENLLCLISNAVKYSPEDGKVVIRVTKRKAQQPFTRSNLGLQSRTPSSSSLSGEEEENRGSESSTDNNNNRKKVIVEPPTPSRTVYDTNAPNAPGGKFEQLIATNKDLAEELLFEVEDSGNNILTEEQGMELFQDPNQSERMNGGTGIGLFSLAKRIEALHGSYGFKKRVVAPSPRAGEEKAKYQTIFWFSIPYFPKKHTHKPAVPTVTLPNKSVLPAIFIGEDKNLLGCASTDRIRTTSSPNAAALAACLRANGSPAVSKSTSNCSSRKPSVSLEELKNLSILLVDDSPSILKMCSMMLKRQGHSTTTAENGEIALKKLEEKWRTSGRGFDLVLMDLQMPVMDGLEAAKRFRTMENEGTADFLASSAGFHQIIFGISATCNEETIQQTFTVGMDEFLSKPFSVEKVMEKYLLKRNEFAAQFA